jgi:hypothetical protein
MNTKASVTLGLFIALGLFSLGYILGGSIVKFKSFERTVKVKGLAQKEVNADTVIWPIAYLRASNDLSKLYDELENDTSKIQAFLEKKGFTKDEITITAPSITDKMAQGYGGNQNIKFRYSAVEVLTVYTKNIDLARESMTDITKLGKAGITFRSNNYNNQTVYMFTGLNEIKPQMIQEVTRNARASAQKFAEDSQSTLGKIRKANQGQFSISARDKNTPYIKRVRVVSTIEYYLTD